MLLLAQYVWFEPVLIASIVVFIIELVGNSITFSNRHFSALVGYGNVSMSVTRTPSSTAPAQK